MTQYHTLYSIRFFSLSFFLRYKLPYLWTSNNRRETFQRKLNYFLTSLFHPLKNMSICFVYRAIQKLNHYPDERYQGNQLCYPPFEYLSPEVELSIHQNLPLKSCNSPQRVSMLLYLVVTPPRKNVFAVPWRLCQYYWKSFVHSYMTANAHILFRVLCLLEQTKRLQRIFCFIVFSEFATESGKPQSFNKARITNLVLVWVAFLLFKLRLIIL